MQLDLIQKVAIWILPILFAVTAHEAAHGWMASRLGDQTAKMLGRLTLNPMKHIDWLGTVIVPVLLLMTGGIIFGWAKPVPVSPVNFKKPRQMMAMVAVAGPVANFAMVLVWAFIAKIALLVATMLPSLRAVVLMGIAGIYINVFIGVFNLIPIPPLDGGRVVSNLIPPKMAFYYDKIEPFGFFILLALIFTGVIFHVLGPILALLINGTIQLFGII